MKTLKIIGLAIMFMLSIGFVNAATLYQDDFNDNTLNTSLWFQTGTGCSETGGRLVCSTSGTTWGDNGFTTPSFNYQDYDNVTIEYTTTPDDYLSGTHQAVMGFGDNNGGVSFTTGEYLFYHSDDKTVAINEDGSPVGTSFTTSTGLYNFKIEIFNGGTAKYYYKANASSTWTLHYTSSKSPSDTSMGFLFSHKIGNTYIDDFIMYSDSVKSSAPTTTPTISIDDISLINNSFYNTHIDIQLNISQVDSNDNINTSYSLDNGSLIQFGTNTLQPTTTISLTETTTTPIKNTYKLYSGYDTDVTAEQYCQENYNGSYVSYDISPTSGLPPVSETLTYYNGSEWLTASGTGYISNLECRSLLDGQHTIYFQAENSETQTNSSQYIFTIDTQPANVSVNDFTEWNDGYTVTNLNDTLNITCEDANLVSCEIHWEDNTTTNILNTQNKTFTYNGNYTFELHSHDDAGNTAIANGTLFVNPYQYFNFFNIESSTYVSNFSFGGKSFPGTQANFTTYELGLGTQDLKFDKSGYVTTQFKINITNTSEINQTFNVEKARVIFRVYDQVSNNLITTQTINLEVIGESSFTANTSTGIFNLTSIVIPGEYQAKVSTNDYISTEKTFTFDAKSLYESNFYLIPTNYTLAGYVTVITYNSDNTYAKSITVTGNQWDSSSSTFVETFRTRSNTNGRAVIPIILEEELYKFCAQYNTGTVCFPEGGVGQSFSRTQNGEEIPILADVSFPTIDTTIFSNLQFNLLYNTVSNFSTDFLKYSISYSWQTQDGTDATLCAKLSKDFNFTETEVAPINCSTTNSGLFAQDYILNKSFSYKFIVYDGDTNQILYRDYILGDNSLMSQLSDFNFTTFIKVLIVVLMVGIIPFLKYPLLIIADIIGVFIFSWLYIIPQSLSITTVGVYIVLGIITMWAVSKK